MKLTKLTHRNRHEKYIPVTSKKVGKLLGKITPHIDIVYKAHYYLEDFIHYDQIN